jgi:hypothetical protein
MLKALRESTQLEGPFCLHYGMCKKETYFNQDEVMTLQEVGFSLSEKPKCHPKNLFGDDASLPASKQANANN